MLKNLRDKKTAKKIWIVLMVLIMPGFIVWGLGSIVRDKQKNITPKGKIFGKTISDTEYQEALSAVKTQMVMQLGDQFSELQKYLNLDSQAWDRLILLREAKTRKIKATDQEIIELLESYPFFQRKGSFDNRTYSEVLKYAFRIQPRAFEEQTRQNIILSKLYKQITDKITISDEEIKKEYTKTNEESSLSYIAAQSQELAKNINPSDEEIKTYFNTNAAEFKQSVSYNLEYISSDSEDKINETAKVLKKINDLTLVSIKSGLEIKETGFFSQEGAVPGIGWDPEIMNTISKLQIKEISPVIHTDKYYITRLKELKEARVPELSEIKDKIKEKYIKIKSKELAKAKIEECLGNLKENYKTDPKSVDFNKAAKTFGLKSAETKPFKRNSYVEGIGSSEELWEPALKLKEGEFSEVITMDSGFYIIKLKSHTTIDEKKFESEKAEFSKKTLEQKKQENFSKFSEELKRKASEINKTKLAKQKITK